MSEERVRISELPVAADVELTDDAWAIINTPLQKTKRVLMSKLIGVLFGGVKQVKVTIPSAQVKTLHSVPVIAVVKTGAGTAIAVVRASYRMRNSTIPYATNITLEIGCDGATLSQCRILNGLAVTVNSHKYLGQLVSSNAADTQIVEDANLIITEPSGDPTAGDGDMDVYILYRELTL